MVRIAQALLLIILFAPSVSAMTLDEAVQYALENNPDLQAFRLEEEIIKGQEEKARLPFRSNPTIETNLARKGESPVEEGSRRFTDYGFKLSQEFEIAGQRGVRISIANRDLSRIGLEIRNRERILIYEVKDAFARTIASKEKVNLTKEVIRIQQELLDFTRKKFETGDVSALSVNLAEVELSKAKRETLLAEKEYRENLLMLQGLLGQKPNPALNLEGALPTKMISLPNKEEMIASSLSRRPDVLAVSEEIDLAKNSFDLVKRESVPNITVAGFYEKDEGRNVVGVEFSIPIPFFDRKQAEKREALVRAQQARIKQAGLQGAVRQEIEAACSNLASAQGELSLFRAEILSKILENMNLLNLAFKEGKIGFFDVRLAQRDTLDHRFSYLDAQLKTLLAINALERAIAGN